MYFSCDWEESKGIQFYLLFEQKYLASDIVFHQIAQSCWCKSDRAHSTWLCAIICLPEASFTEIKHESPGSQVNATLPKLKETLVCFKQVFPHCRVREKSFLNNSYSCNSRFSPAWDKHGEFVAAVLQLLLPLGFHRTSLPGRVREPEIWCWAPLKYHPARECLLQREQLIPAMCR